MADAEGALRVTVAYSPRPRQVDLWELRLPPGATVAEALERCGLFEAHPPLRGQALTLAVWGRPVGRDHRLRERDRVEVLRPLQVDPKVARRQRFIKQGSRGTGLFARKRGPG